MLGQQTPEERDLSKEKHENTIDGLSNERSYEREEERKRVAAGEKEPFHGKPSIALGYTLNHV